MDKNQKREYEMFVRVRDFGQANANRFPASTKGGDAFAAVDAAVNALNQHTAAQFSSRPATRAGASTDMAAFRALVEMLDAISRTARPVALDVPGVDKRFRVPKRNGRLTIVNAARAFARDVEPLASQFIAHGMPTDFVAQLTAKIAGVEQALQEREASKELNASARASMTGAIESGLHAVQRLDAIVANVLGDDASTMASWTVARRIDHYASPKRSGAAPAATGTATAAAATGASATAPATGTNATAAAAVGPGNQARTE